MDRSDLIVVAFDGDCLMCSRSIRFLAEHDPQRRFRFAKLQDPVGKRMEEKAGTGALNTVVVESGGEVFSRSDAILGVLHGLGGGWRILSALGHCIPRSLRDAAYNFIAARRHKWFGKGDACAMPSEALRERLM